MATGAYVQYAVAPTANEDVSFLNKGNGNSKRLG